MRIGRNPNQGEFCNPKSNITALVVVHLPNLIDYHLKRFHVVKHCISTLIRTIETPVNLVIWDNDSCAAVIDWLVKLKRTGLVDCLIMSPNIGKVNALKAFARSMPKNSILAYSDDDIEFFSGWLAAQLEILETYPNVGIVTGYPTRLQGLWGTAQTRAWAQKFANIELGKFIPDEWEEDHCASLGVSWQDHHCRLAGLGLQDFKITYKAVEAYALSHHCQFICYPERIEPLLNWTQELMPAEHLFDEAVDNFGFLRLSTIQRYTRHIGNVLS